MRILITVPWTDRLGGAEAMLHTILQGANESGHEIELVFFEEGPWPAELARAGLQVEVFKAGRVRQLHRWAATVARLTAKLRRRRPDLILNWAAKTQVYGAPAAMLAGMSERVVWWQHSIADRTPLELIANALPARAIACYSTAAARAQAQLRPRRATVVIAAGTAPPPPHEHSDMPLPEGVPVVGIVGRLQPWKGQDRLLRAQALLRDRGRRFHLVIVGGDSYNLSPDYAASLPGLVRQLGLEGEVTLTGEVPDAAPYIDRMDVLVNASDPEPFGIVLLEGMAAGVAVLAVDSGGPPDFIEDRRTGVLARSGRPEDLAAGLEPLLDSAELRRRLGSAGRESFARDYTDTALRRRFFTTLERVVQGGTNGDADAREP